MRLPCSSPCWPYWLHLSSPLSFLHFMLSFLPSALSPPRDTFPTVPSPSLLFILQVSVRWHFLQKALLGQVLPLVSSVAPQTSFITSVSWFLWNLWLRASVSLHQASWGQGCDLFCSQSCTIAWHSAKLLANIQWTFVEWLHELVENFRISRVKLGIYLPKREPLCWGGGVTKIAARVAEGTSLLEALRPCRLAYKMTKSCQWMVKAQNCMCSMPSVVRYTHSLLLEWGTRNL